MPLGVPAGTGFLAFFLGVPLGTVPVGTEFPAFSVPLGTEFPALFRMILKVLVLGISR